MNKWGLRIVGILFVLMLIMILMQMQRALIRMSEDRGVTTTTSR